MPEAIIIGAGPGGSVAALLLARAGWKTTIIEQRNFPRDKVCGGCISALGVGVLEQLGILPLISSLGAVNLHSAELHPPAGRAARFHLPSAMLGVSRRALDDALLNAARDAGAVVLQPWRFETVADGIPPRVETRELSTRQLHTLEADWILMADGKPQDVRRNLSRQDRDFGIQAHFRDVLGQNETIELFGCRQAYAGLAPVEGGQWNIACAVPSWRIRDCKGNIAALFRTLCHENPTLARRMKAAKIAGDWHAAPLPRFPLALPHEKRILRIGNAAAAIEPIGGEGMGLALRSAQIAASLLIGSESPDDAPRIRRDVLGHFRTLWRIRSPATRLAGDLASSPAGAQLLTTLLRTVCPLHAPLLRALGKTQSDRGPRFPFGK